MNISLSPFAPELLVSRDGFGSPVPRQPAHLHTPSEFGSFFTYGIPPTFRGGVHLFILIRHTPSGQSRFYRVTQLRTDGVHCRESAGISPVNLKVVPATGAAFSSITIGRCCFFPTTTSQFDTPCKGREEENASNQRQKKREAEEADKVEVAPGVTVASLRRFRTALIGPTQGLPKRRRLCR